MIIRYSFNYNMIDNFNVSLELTKNAQDEIEVNGYNRRTLINNNLIGIILLLILNYHRPVFLRIILRS